VRRPAEPVTSWDDVGDVLDIVAAGDGPAEMVTPRLVALVP
jgi:hypothetical protein